MPGFRPAHFSATSQCLEKQLYLCGLIAVALTLCHTSPVPAADSLKDRLKNKIDLEIDGQTLRDGLKFISERFSIPIEIDTAAFKKNGIKDVESHVVRLGHIVKMPLGTVLDKMAAQVDGIYRIKGKKVIISPKAN